MIIRVRLSCRGLLAGLLVLALTIPAGAAPSGPPIRIGGTLALTGPLAPTALLHIASWSSKSLLSYVGAATRGGD